ncbi:MAG: ABC transporter permease, partial [Leptothrix sp. (in: Bacteria)]|nr:ABC transporter permease [Leptothrix sp. (in: b-proteobacteria)]
MSTSAVTALPAVGTPELRQSLLRADRRRRLTAVGLTLPLLVFLLLTLLVPIGALLGRAIENPEVARALPRTGAALAGWDHKSEPAAAAFAAVAQDLGALAEGSDAGALARRLNSEVPGGRSLIMGTYRAVHGDWKDQPLTDAAAVR